MEEAYYYSHGRRIPVARLQSAQVVRLPEDREFVSIPGWRSIALGNNRFQLLVRADVVPERALRVTRLEELVDNLRAAEAEIANQPPSNEQRSLQAEFSAQAIPVLLGMEGGLLLPTGEIVAKFRPGLSQSDIESAAEQQGARLIRTLSFMPNTYLLQPSAGGDGLDLANRLVESGLVEFASPNFIEEMPWRSLAVPPNVLFPQQWHLHNVGQNGARPTADVRALEAWQITTGTPEIIVCIIDSGVDSRHPAFATAGKLVPGYDFQDNDVLADPTTSSHGTSCAGVAVAPWGIGRVVGIAPDCRLMPIRRSTLSEHLKMAEAFIWAADHGADVISCSFGYDFRPWVLPDLVRAAIDQAATRGRNGKGCVIIWAGGNGGEGISSDEWASNDKVLAVGASTDQDVRASYSDFGPELDVCAPSNGGRNGITTTSNGGYTDQFGGTSSAAPLVAGIAALLLSVNPNLTWREVQDILRRSADRIDPEGGNYDANGHSDLYGYGRVNAYRALNAISALAEVARDSDVEPRLASIRQFAAEVLEPRPAGRQILRFLEGRSFQILRLLRTRPDFRQHAVTVLRTTADAFEALQRGGEIVLSDAFWQAVVTVTRPLLAEMRVTGAERHLNLNGEERTVATQTEVPTTTLDASLRRLEQVLRGGESAERDATGTQRPAGTSALGLEDFFEAASAAVLRALEAREQQNGGERVVRALIGPITVGLIFNPPIRA